MEESRPALIKILPSLQFLAMQGIIAPDHTHTDETSNLTNLLLLRREDCPELKSWLERDSYKRLPHDVCNKMLEIMSHSVLRNLIVQIKEAKYYALTVDETADISVKE